MTCSPTMSVVISRSRLFWRFCSISSVIFSSLARGTVRFSQARIILWRILLRSKLWRLPSFLMTTMGRDSMVS